MRARVGMAWLAIVVAFGIAGYWASRRMSVEPEAPANDRTSQAQNKQPSLTEMLRGLSSSDAIARRSAQEALRKLPPDRIEALKQVSADAQDVEVRTQLDQRIAGMERALLFHRGGLSIDVTKATLAEVVERINAQVREENGLTRTRDYLQVQGALPGSFTLHLKNASLVDVLRAMNEQCPLSIPLSNSYTAFIQIADPPESAPFWTYDPDGSFAIQTQVERTSPGWNADKGEPVKWRLLSRLYLDPRVHFAWREANEALSVVLDDKGNDLLGVRQDFKSFRNPEQNLWLPAIYFGGELSIPSTPGNKIATAKIVLHWGIAEDFKQAEIADIRKVQGVESIQLGDKTLLVELSSNGPKGLVDFKPSLWEGNPLAPSRMLGLKLNLYEGENLYSTQPGSMNTEQYIRFSDKPMKLMIYYPTKVTPVEVPIEIGGIPLP